MNKRLIVVLALAFVVGLSFAAYAEVQNVKVSGDLTVSGVARNNFDLAKTPPSGSNQQISTATLQDEEADMLSITRVRVDADLTDNVSTTVRLLNERNWNGESIAGTAENNRNIGFNGANVAASESQIDIDLAFVTLKEFLYSPLSVTLGRQELRFGNGWIVGDPDTNGIALKSQLAEGDLSARKSFDAVRASLNYDPLMVDVIYSKLAENSTVLNDDTTLTGVNAMYALNDATSLEGFFFSKIRGSNAAEVAHVDTTRSFTDQTNGVGNSVPGIKEKADVVNTTGLRIVNKSINNLVIDAQAAYQFGTYNPKFDTNAYYSDQNTKAETARRSAWGTEIVAMYDLKDVDAISKYSPTLGGAYVFLSGENRNRAGNSTYNGWDAMFEDQTFGHIINATLGFSNVHLVGVTAQAKPMEDVTAKLDYVAVWLDKKYPEGRTLAVLSGVAGSRQFIMGDTRFLGNEYDVSLTYNYTEDVQFSLLGGIFLPSKAINTYDGASNQRRTPASELIGSMKVTF